MTMRYKSAIFVVTVVIGLGSWGVVRSGFSTSIASNEPFIAESLFLRNFVVLDQDGKPLSGTPISLVWHDSLSPFESPQVRRANATLKGGAISIRAIHSSFYRYPPVDGRRPRSNRTVSLVACRRELQFACGTIDYPAVRYPVLHEQTIRLADDVMSCNLPYGYREYVCEQMKDIPSAVPDVYFDDYELKILCNECNSCTSLYCKK